MSFSSEKGQRGWGLCLAPFFVLLISNFANAADYSVSARQVRDVSYSSSGATVDYSLQAKFAANDPRYKTSKVKYGPAKVLDFAKSRKTLNPAAAAVNAVVIVAVAAAGWAIDELTNQVVRPNQNQTFLDDGSWTEGKFWAVSGESSSSINSYAPTRSVACSRIDGVWKSSPYNACAYTNHLGTTSYKTVVQYTCGKWYSTTSMSEFSGCGLEPSSPFEPVPESEWWSQVMDAISHMSPEAQREFWNNVAGMPELTPELQQALDDWNAEIASETGLNGETKEESSSDVANDVQDVRVVDPIEIVEPDLNTDPEQTGGTTVEDYDPLIDTLNTLPALPDFFIPDVGFESSTTCETVNFSWRSASVDFPSPSQCSKLNDAKRIIGWFLNIITMFGCAWLILGNRGIAYHG